MENTYHYYAFISYATTDSKLAKWLQHQLSYYHIPTSVKKSKIGIPNKIRPIFIYEYDLAGNQLHQAIEQELSASKYLIVICSPNAAKSKYVNREVETFIKQGRSEYIIPFIVDGEVNSKNPEKECFPPALLELFYDNDPSNDPRAANIQTNGKRQALVDVVATMLGVRRDLLWNRYKARLMKQRFTMGLLAVFAILFGLFYWDYTRPTYKYFADYVDVWGVPNGIIELDDEQVSHRYGMYRFEYRRVPIGVENPYSDEKRRVVEVNFINSQGVVMEISETEHFNRYPILNIAYNDDAEGRIDNITCCSHDNKKVVRYKISDDNGVPAANFDIENISVGGGSAHVKSSTTIKIEMDEVNAKISRYHYFRDEKTGLILGVSYHRSNDRLDESLISDAEGVCVESYKLDSLGRIVCRYYLNNEGKQQIAASGVSAREYEYDQYGNISKIICRDLEGRLVNNDSGWAIGISKCNDAGNPLEEYYLDANEEPCNSTDFGYHRVTIEYGDNNVPCKYSFFDVHNNLSVTKKGYAQAFFKSDNLGRITEMSFFDNNDNPCFDSEVGCHSAQFKYQEKGNRIIEFCNYGINNHLCLNKEGYAILSREYDLNGNLYIERRLDENREPTFGNDGVYAIKYFYSRDKIALISNYGVDGILREDATGSAIYKLEYDDRGNVNLITHCNRNNNVANNSSGYAYVKKEYNDSGQQLREEYYDEEQNLCINPELMCARIEYTYDENGNLGQMVFWGEDSTMCIGVVGAAKVECKYDHRRNLVLKKYYGDKNQLIDVKGSAIEEHTFNNVNQCIESRFYSAKNRLLRVEKNEYDEFGNCVQTRYYNSQQEPYLKGSTACITQYRYEGFRLIEQIYSGVSGKMEEGPNGYAKVSIKYDERGNVVEVLYFDESNSLRRRSYAKVEKGYNSRGQITREAYYNAQECFVAGDDGYAQGIVTYDKLGNICDKYYLDENGELMSFFSEEIAKCSYVYDERGNCIEEKYYDKENRLCDHDGVAKIVSEYNENNDITKVAIYNERNELNENGWAISIMKYDEIGNRIELSFQNKCGAPCLGPENYAKKTYKYNERGEQTETAYYGIDSALCLCNSGYAKCNVEYDDKGEIISLFFYDENGNDITEQFIN